MSLPVKETRLKTTRNFSPYSSAEGVTFQGPEQLSNSVFAMDFHQPKYVFLDKNHPYPNIELNFRKSVLFYQNLLVCLGRGIRMDNGPGKKVQTLFRDKLVRGGSAFSFSVGGVRKDNSSSFPTMTLQPFKVEQRVTLFWRTPRAIATISHDQLFTFSQGSPSKPKFGK